MIVRDEELLDGVLVRVTTSDTDARIVTIEENGVVIDTYPFGDEETARFGSDVESKFGQAEQMVKALVREYAASQAALDPKSRPDWVQPVTINEGYLPGAVVKHSNKTWRNNVTVLNVWEPGSTNSGWIEI